MSNSIVAINIVRKNNKKRVAASLFKRESRDSFSGLNPTFTISLYEFDETEQFSNLDALLLQIGSCTLYLSEDFEDKSKGDGKKIFNNILLGKDFEVVFVKNAFFQGNPTDLAAKVLRLTGKATHSTNVAEMEMPLAYRTLECLMRALQLADDEECVGRCAVELGSLGTCMRLDSAAAEAVNLLPRPDHPSQFGSLFGEYRSL